MKANVYCNQDVEVVVVPFNSVKRNDEVVDEVWLRMSESFNCSHFIDVLSIHKCANMLTAWVMINLNEPMTNPNGVTVKSIKSHYEFDCNNKKMLPLYFALHSENMGKGECYIAIDDKEKQGDWIQITYDPKVALAYEFASSIKTQELKARLVC